jgi:hypothetical protein
MRTQNFRLRLLPVAIAGIAATIHAPASAAVETRLYTGACAVKFRNASPNQAGFLADLASGAVTALISTGFDMLTNYLDAQAQDKDFTTKGTANTEFGDKQTWDCLHLVRGEFDGPIDATKGYAPPGADAAAFKALGIPATKVQLFVEARMVLSSDHSAWTILPTRVYYGTAIENGKTLKDPRNVSLAVTFRGAGVAETAKEVSAAIVPLGEMATTTSQEYVMPLQNDGDSVPVAVKGTWGQLGQTDGVIQSPWSGTFLSGTKKTVATPYVVSMSMTETRPGSPLAKFLSGVLKPLKPKAQTALETLIIPGKQAAADLADFEASMTAAKAYNALLAEWQTARVNYCAASAAATPDGKKDRISKSRLMADAETLLVIAAAKAKLTSPVVKPVVVSDGPIDATICAP